MSHPHSPHVSPDSASATALSHAADTQAHPADATSTDQESTSTAGTSLLTKAQDWLQSSGLPTSLPQVPVPLKRVASQATGAWQKLSTTQLVVGAAVLTAGSWLLLRRSGSAKRASSHASPLHELLLFVNDRVEGYQRAAKESQDADLRGYYQQLAGQSQQFASRLNGYLRAQDGGQEKGTTLKGKLYRAWMEAKAAVTGYSEEAVLDSNVYGEEWALKAYEEALADSRLTGSLRREIQRQYEQSQQTYQRLQQLQAQY